MRLFLINQPYQGYDTYDSMVVSAKNAEDAFRLSQIKTGDLRIPRYTLENHTSESVWRNYHDYRDDNRSDWRFENMTIRVIAEITNEPEGVVLASFNAG